MIDERWNNTLHRPIDVAGIYLNPTFSYPYGFLFDVEIMDGFLPCVQRMVRSPAERSEISKEMEIYRMAGGTFSFEMVVVDRKNQMSSIFLVCFKFHCLFKFITSYFTSTFKIHFFSYFIFFLCYL